MSYFRRFRDYAISGILLALPFFFLSAHLKNPHHLGVIDRGLLRISAPVQYGAHRVADSVSSLLEEYVYLVDVKADNERLSEELTRVRQDSYRLREVSAENERMSQLLGLRERLHGETITARVIGKETSPYFRVIRIRLDRGEDARLHEGMPVVSSMGLVGQIRRVYDAYSDVLLTVDSASRVDVVIPRNGARGILRGTGEDNRYRCRIQYLERGDAIETGDEIYTSGLGQRFPASILVGRVTNVEVRNDHGLSQMVEVTPAVGFADVNEVLILTAGPRGQGLEDQGS